MDARPVHLEEFQQRALDAVRVGGCSLDSGDFGGRRMTNEDIQQLRHFGYDVHVRGDGFWQVNW